MRLTYIFFDFRIYYLSLRILLTFYNFFNNTTEMATYYNKIFDADFTKKINRNIEKGDYQALIDDLKYFLSSDKNDADLKRMKEELNDFEAIYTISPKREIPLTKREIEEKIKNIAEKVNELIAENIKYWQQKDKDETKVKTKKKNQNIQPFFVVLFISFIIVVGISISDNKKETCNENAEKQNLMATLQTKKNTFEKIKTISTSKQSTPKQKTDVQDYSVNLNALQRIVKANLICNQKTIIDQYLTIMTNIEHSNDFKNL